MSKLLNDEQRVIALKRDTAKDKFADLPPFPEAAPEPPLQNVLRVSEVLGPEPVQPAAAAPAAPPVTPSPAPVPAAPPLDQVPPPT
ncbi:MAG: hypothetical protein Q8S13_12820, partial [Dehalococcoidia bacterium]|nr:hypothetical protein [Dehalococcoidia bacterium]